METLGTRRIFFLYLTLLIAVTFISYKVSQLSSSDTTQQETNSRHTFTPQPQNAQIRRCPFEIRRQFMQHACKDLSQSSSNNSTKPIRVGFIMDRERKTLGCQAPKTGSRSWLQFLVDSKKRLEPAMSNTEFLDKYKDKYNIRRNDFLKKISLEYHTLTKEELEGDFKNWTKYIIVRHPLQRAISAFYHLLIGQDDLTTLADFFANIALTPGYVNINANWVNYNEVCKVCDIDYDIIIKSETIEEDTVAFKEAVGLNLTGGVPFTHLNRIIGKDLEARHTGKDNYKYDFVYANLSSISPSVMRGCLEAYNNTFKLFGYGWDSKTKSSHCRLQVDSVECC